MKKFTPKSAFKKVILNKFNDDDDSLKNELLCTQLFKTRFTNTVKTNESLNY